MRTEVLTMLLQLLTETYFKLGIQVQSWQLARNASVTGAHFCHRHSLVSQALTSVYFHFKTSEMPAAACIQTQDS